MINAKLSWRIFVVALFCAGSPLHADPIVDPTPDTGNSLDRTHDFLSNVFYWPVAFTDQLFMEESDEFRANESYFRVIGHFTWVDYEGFSMKPQFRAKVRLKALQRKLSLIAFGENDDEASPDIDSTKKTIGRDTRQVGRDTSRTRVGFRYNVAQWFNTDFDADLVVSKEFFPEPSLRGRVTIYKSDRAQSQFSTTGFYKKALRYGYITRLNYKHQMAKRWGHDTAVSVRQSQEFPALQWDSAINLNYLLSIRETMALRLQAVGVTRPYIFVLNYRSSVVYRRNFYRTWLFYEVEPGVDWPYRPRVGSPPYRDGTRLPVWSSAFRIEIVFKSI
jgi:hypothetical protein